MAERGRPAGFVMGPEHRTKIAKSRILGNLVKFAEGAKDAPKLSPHQVTAALGLLKKVMPDLTENMIKGDDDAPLTLNITRRIIGPDGP